MGDFDKSRYNNEYNRNNYTSISIRLNNKTESDIIKHLQHSGSAKQYLVSLIKKDMQKKARRSKYITGGSGYEHSHIKQYPYEVIELLPGNDHYTIGYCESIDDCALLIMNYATRQGVVSGSICIYKRDYNPWLNAVYAKEYGNG